MVEIETYLKPIGHSYHILLSSALFKYRVLDTTKRYKIIIEEIKEEKEYKDSKRSESSTTSEPFLEHYNKYNNRRGNPQILLHENSPFALV